MHNLAILMLILVMARVQGSSCPKNCQCSSQTFICKRAKLQKVPDEIPLSISYVDLSNNPQMKFQPEHFRRFRKLKFLYLDGCSINHPVYLPHSIRSIKLSRNLLTIEMIKKMLGKGSWPNLKALNLAANKIQIDDGNKGFSALPRSITDLNLAGNRVAKIGKNDLQFRHLTKLQLSNCSLSDIEPGAFRLTIKLRELQLDDNKLTRLPDLRNVENLIELFLRKNRLTHVAMEELGVKKIRSLSFRFNKITSFNMTGTSVYSLDLSRNKITRLEDSAFSEQKVMDRLFIHNNKINYISPRAFKGITSLDELFLQRNELRSLPRGLFKGFSIRQLYLFENKLEKVDGLLDGIKRAPELVLLFGNPGIKEFKASDFVNMRKGSVIYIGCTQLMSIVGGDGLQADVKCSPSKDLIVLTPTTALRGEGFQCKKRTDFLYRCEPCPVGYSEICKEEECGGTCIPCPAGSFYQDEMAKTYCKPCTSGQYVPPENAPGKSPADCLTCPQNTNTNSSAGYRACPCLQGYIRKYRFGGCEKCETKGLVCNRDYPEVEKGYWVTWESIKTAKNESCEQLFLSFMHNLDTKNNTYNRSTVNFTSCNMPTPYKCPIKDSCRGGAVATCETGYSGVLCAVCSPGYMKQFNKCRKCPSSGVAITQCIVFVFSFVFVCWLISKTDKINLAEEQHNEELSNNQGGEQAHRTQRTFADIILASLKILLGYYQVVSGLIHALSFINWPHSLKSVMGILQYVQFEILRMPSLHCIKAEWKMDAVDEFWLALIATFVVPLLIFLYFVLATCVLFTCPSSDCNFREKRDIYCKNSLRAAALFLFATYPLTCTRIVQILPISCHKFCTVSERGKCLREVSYLRCDYSLGCLSNSDSPLLQTAYAALLIPVGLPIALLLLLWRFAPRNRRIAPAPNLQFIRLNSANDDGDVYYNADIIENGRTDCGTIQFALRFAFENYREPCWYWEVLEMVRKLIMTVGVVIFLEHTKIGLGGIIIIATAFTLAQAVLNPIQDTFENNLQLLSLTIVPMNLTIGAIIHSQGLGEQGLIDEKDDSFALGIVLVILNSLLIVLVACRFIRAIALKIAANRRKPGNRNCLTRCLDFLRVCLNLAPINNQLYRLHGNTDL